jgi:hypothetical protein
MNLEPTLSGNETVISAPKSIESNAVLDNILINIEVSYFNDISHKTDTKIKMADFLNDIKSGKWKTQIDRIRSLVTSRGAKDKEVRDLKVKTLPAIATSGIFEKEHSNKAFLRHSSLICMDFDNLGSELGKARIILSNDPYCMALFTSPTGTGLKAIVPTAAIDQKSHKASFDAYNKHYQGLGLPVDESGKDITRLCFASYDPNLWIKHGPIPSPIPPLWTVADTEPLSDALTNPLSESLSTAEPLTGTVTVGQINNPAINTTALRIKKFNEFKNKQPEVYELYQKIISPLIEIAPNKRNETLLKFVPIAYTSISYYNAYLIAEQLLILNSDVFKGTKEEHLNSFQSLWKGQEADYLNRLSSEESSIYQLLSDRQKTIFRILKDLSQRKPDRSFYMSGVELSKRVDPKMHGYRELRQFYIDYNIIEITKKGDSGTRSNRRASEYKWILPTN